NQHAAGGSENSPASVQRRGHIIGRFRIRQRSVWPRVLISEGVAEEKNRIIWRSRTTRVREVLAPVLANHLEPGTNMAAPFDSARTHLPIVIDNINSVPVFSQSNRGISGSAPQIEDAERSGATALRQRSGGCAEKRPVKRHL